MMSSLLETFSPKHPYFIASSFGTPVHLGEVRGQSRLLSTGSGDAPIMSGDAPIMSPTPAESLKPFAFV